MATNNTTQQREDNEDDDVIPTIVKNQIIYLFVIAVIGVIANLIVLEKSIVYQRRSTNHNRLGMSTTNFLVISLAVSDLGTSTFSVAIFILPSYVPNFPINEFTCKYIQPFRELFFAVSIFSVAFIAVCRYLILHKTFLKIMTSNIINNIILWIMCYLIFALPFSAVYTVLFVDGAPICEAVYDTTIGRRAHRTFIAVANVFLPSVMVTLSYVGIIRRLRRARMVVIPEEVANKVIKSEQIPMGLIVQSHRIVKISILLLISFWVTFLPYTFLVIAVEYGYLNGRNTLWLEQVAAVAICLLYSGIVLNPLILMFTSDLYRPKLETFLYCFACWNTVSQNPRINSIQ